MYRHTEKRDRCERKIINRHAERHTYQWIDKHGTNLNKKYTNHNKQMCLSQVVSFDNIDDNSDIMQYLTPVFSAQVSCATF